MRAIIRQYVDVRGCCVSAPCKKMVRSTMTCVGNGIYRVEYMPTEVGQFYLYARGNVV